jgi:oligosaccharide repeat unit polymerase
MELLLLLALAFLVVSLLLFVPTLAFVGFGCVLAATLLWGRRSPLSFVSPVVLLQLSALAYSVLLPFSKAAGLSLHIARAGLIQTEAFDQALVLSLGSSVAMMLGAYVAQRKWMPGVSPRSPGVSSDFRIAAWVLLIIGAAAVYGLLASAGGVWRLSTLPYGARYLAVGSVSFLKYGPVLLAFSAAAFYYDLQFRRSLSQLVGIGFAVTLLFLDASVMERRTPIYIAIASVLVIRTILGRSRRAAWLVGAGVVLLLSVPITSYLRAGGDVSQLSMDRVNPASYEFGSSYLTLVDIVGRVSESDDLRLGSTYLSAIGVLVPRALWPDRPKSLPEWYVTTHYQSLARAGGGLAFSPVAEAYMNFGLGGVLAVFVFVGIAAVRFESFLASQLPRDRTWVLGYALLAPWLVLFYRLDFGSFLKLGILYTLLLFLFLRVLNRAFDVYRRRLRSAETPQLGAGHEPNIQ